MLVTRIYDEDLAQAAWLIGCQDSNEAIIIDPERDVCRYIEVAKKAGLRITAVAETHIHADFLSGSHELAVATGATIYLSSYGGADWSYAWPSNTNATIQLVKDGDTFTVGNIKITVVHTPGHTPEHICFLINDIHTNEPIGYVTGDFVFVGDLGRPDLLETAAGFEGAMEASAKQLHASCQRFMNMDEYVQVWPGHGAGSACGKALGAVPQSTVGYEQRTCPPLQLVGSESDFVDYMLTNQPEPPLYFARMKQMNRDGVPLLGKLPTPKRITESSELVLESTKATVIDTRSWNEVRDGHLPNSIWSLPNASFHRFAGSFVSAEDDIVFIVTEKNLDRAIRNAVRIGLDNIVAWADPSVMQGIDTLESMPEISASELDEIGKVAVLDVRRKQEFDAGSIPGAAHIAHTRLLEQLDEIDPSIPLIVNCHGGSRSAAACMALRRNGYAVTNLAGGYSGWKANTQSSATAQ